MAIGWSSGSNFYVQKTLYGNYMLNSCVCSNLSHSFPTLTTMYPRTFTLDLLISSSNHSLWTFHNALTIQRRSPPRRRSRYARLVSAETSLFAWAASARACLDMTLLRSVACSISMFSYVIWW